MEDVTVQYFKYRADGDHALHWRHEMIRLGDDEHGTWLGGPPHATLQRGHEPERSYPHAFVQLLSADNWWTLIHNDASNKTVHHYVDIITRPVWENPNRVTMIDLDLDVIQQPDGTVYVDDEDEFLEHQVAHDYPPQLIDMTRVTTAEVVLAIEASREPFASAAGSWLARLRESH